MDERPATTPEMATTHLATLRRRAVRGGMLLMVTRLVTQLFVWAATLLIARFLTPLDYGLMSIGLLFVTIADMFAEAGIGKALIQKEHLEPRDLDEGFTVSLCFGLVLYALLAALADPLADFYGTPELPTFLRVLALNVVMAPFVSVPLALLDRDLSMGTQSAIHFGTALAQSALVLLLAIAGLGYWALAAGSLARRVLETGCYLVAAGWRPRLARPGARARGLLRFGLHVSIALLLWFLYTNVDYAVVGKIDGPVILGFYALAFQLASMPAEKLTANLNKVAFPIFSRLQNDAVRLRDWFLRLLVLLGFLGMPVMVGMALVADDGIHVVLGDQWGGAVLAFQLLSLSGLFRIYSAMFPMVYAAMGRPDINTKFNACCAVVFPISYVLAGWAGGMIGICLVWALVFPTAVLVLIQLTRHLTGVGVVELLRSQAWTFAATAFMAGAVLTQQALLPDMLRPLRLALSIVLGAVCYAVPMLSLCRKTVLADVAKLWRELRGGRVETAPATGASCESSAGNN